MDAQLHPVVGSGLYHESAERYKTAITMSIKQKGAESGVAEPRGGRRMRGVELYARLGVGYGDAVYCARGGDSDYGC